MEEIEVIYEDGVFKPVKKIHLKKGTKGTILLKEDIIDQTFGILKGKNLSKLLEEVEDEWGFH
jgi:predicted DNA-binding antitoxin AbrB/MazE fold protein